MSWSLVSVGTAENLANQVATLDYMPVSVKEAIVRVLSDSVQPDGHFLLLQTSGHVEARNDEGIRRWVNIEIKLTTILEAK